MPTFIVRRFSTCAGSETQVIGPFDERKEATRYEKITGKNAQSRDYMEYAYSSRITAKPTAKPTYTLEPNEDILHMVYSDLYPNGC